jgi:streptogramin lyase
MTIIKITGHLLVLSLFVVTLTAATSAFASPVPQAAGTFTEYAIPTANSRPNDISLGPDGNFWFVEQSGNKIGRITARGKITQFPIPTPNALPVSITAGPDGNLWFTEISSNNEAKVGRITPAGKITEFPILNGEPEDITAGPDGNLWFTQMGSSIGRITPSGTITIFSIPTPLAYAQGITAGPDGNVWFVESIGNKIGKINPTSGQINEYVIANGRPQNITQGPTGDHNLWFTGGGGIGKIDPTSGQITVFRLPGEAVDLTASQGFLWYTNEATNAIGRMSVTGTFTEFPIPTAKSNPQGMTVGPHGIIWFAEFDGNKIGKMITH